MEEILEQTKINVRTNLGVNTNLPTPNLYNVILMNDDVTPMEFVVAALIEIFGHSKEEATDLTLQVHEKGSAVVFTNTYELAEQKVFEFKDLSKISGQNMTIKIQENT